MPLNLNKIFPLAIGTWGIGGFAKSDPDNDDTRQIDALAYMFDRGMNFVEINHWYAQGRSAELVAKALKESGKKREDIFICFVVYLKSDKNFEQSRPEFQKTFDLFETDYVDTMQTSMRSILAEEKNMFDWLEQSIASHSTLGVSITNENLSFLKRFHTQFGDNVFSQEVTINFENRVNDDQGMVSYAQANNIKTVAFMPLRRNMSAERKWPLLKKLAHKYHATHNQAILAWLRQKGLLPLFKSSNKHHIDENLASLKVSLTSADFELIDKFRPDWKAPVIDWYGEGKGVDIVNYNLTFDEEYDRQQHEN